MQRHAGQFPSISIVLLCSMFIAPFLKAETKDIRVISLAPHITENIYSAGGGDKLVGVVAFSDYPLIAQQLPIVGNYQAINMEKVIALQPDLIIAWRSGVRSQDLETLAKLGFHVVFSGPSRIQDIADEIRYFGGLLGTEKQAKRTAEKLDELLSSLSSRYENRQQISFFYQIWNRPLMTINGKQFISQALNYCGAVNSFADLPLLAAEISMESLIAKNPEVFLIGGEKQTQQNWLHEWQTRTQLKAVKEHNLYLLNADLYQRPTARLIEAMPELCNVIEQARNKRK